MKQSAFRKAVAGLLGIFILGCILAMTLVIIVDPFFHYHKPLKGFPYLIDNQLSQNPGMAEHMEYDSVILGSSMTVNFQTDWFKELMGLNTIKLSYSGAYPKDQSNIMKIIFDSGHEVKEVFLGIDVITYMGGVDETKYPIPEYLYDDNYLNDIEYVLNKDVILNYILRPMADPDPTNIIIKNGCCIIMKVRSLWRRKHRQRNICPGQGKIWMLTSVPILNRIRIPSLWYFFRRTVFCSGMMWLLEIIWRRLLHSTGIWQSG